MANSVCAMERTLDVVGDWWSLLIVRDAIAGTTRFSEFQRSLGVAKNILTTRLKSLVAESAGYCGQRGRNSQTRHEIAPSHCSPKVCRGILSGSTLCRG